MGLMEQFSKTPRKPSGLAGILSEARRLGGDDPRAAVQRLADSGATVTLPDGRRMPVSELAAMAEGKTAMQLLIELGVR